MSASDTDAEDIDHQYNLLEAHRRTLQHYLRQRATLGRAHEPPAVAAGIAEARAQIVALKEQIRARGHVVDDMPQDVEQPAAFTVPTGRRLLWPALLGGICLLLIGGALAFRLLLGSVFIAGERNITNTGPGSITINQGDPPELRQQKLDQGRRTIISDVLENISAIDARLQFTKVALAPRIDPLAGVRETVAPLGGTPASGYAQLIAAQQIASLRESWNSRPLRTIVDEPLVQVLLESNQDPVPVRLFYQQLVVFEDAGESLIETLTSAGAARTDTPSQQYWQDRIAHAHATYLNRAATAHAAALALIATFNAGDTAAPRLALLEQLTPREPVSEAAAQQLMDQALAEGTQLMQQRATLNATAEALRDMAVATYAALNHELVVQPDDPADLVAKKASALRTLGRVADAIAAYERYGALAAADPTTAQYVQTGIHFANQPGDRARRGGVYVFAVEPGGAGDAAGLRIGDVITSYNGAAVATPDDLKLALSGVPSGTTVAIEWMRFDASGEVTLRQAEVGAGRLGAGFMMI